MSPCSNCGFENPEGARFCNQCGAPLETAARTGERRQITVVFSDLSGFTAMSEALDPEDVQAVMSEIFSTATEIIERYSGRVDKLLGDAVMSVFGDPVSHEDDAERAVRATLEIHAAVDALSTRYEEQIGRPLRMHSGVNTGIVITSSSSFDTADTGPLGDTINLAARLEDLSKSGEILLGPETAALVEAVFALDDYGSHHLKGKSGLIPVASVAGFRSERVGPSRRQAEFVGRHEELGVLLGAVERVQDGETSVIGVKAEAGAGKSRLLAEFHGRVEEKVQWLEGRAYAYGESIPYAALVDLVSRSIGVNEDDTQASIAEKLQAGIGSLVGDEVRLLDPFVRLYGLQEREGAALDKDSFQDRLLESLVAVVDGLCSRSPTVLVLQDLHWADPSTTSIIANLIPLLSHPVVLIANYRPSFERSLPSMREIALSALSPRQSSEMVSSLLDGQTVPPELVDFVVDRTDGNPFFVEEIINSLLETGILNKVDGVWRLAGSLDDADIPTSVRGVIASRIDRLDEDRRRVLREASVVGREFLYDVIKRVATNTATLDPSLADLEHADLIRERDQAADLEYFFKHALTQDVAYEGLLKQERAELHARAAAAIETQFEGRLEEVTETLAFHYIHGRVVDRAVYFSRAAGRKAMDRYALIEAQSHFETAYGLLVEDDENRDNDKALIDLILDWAILFYYQAHFVQLGELLARHQEVADRLGDDRRRMWWLIWKGHVGGAEFDQSDNMRDLSEALRMAEQLGDSAGIAYAKTWMIWSNYIRGDLEEGLRLDREVVRWTFDNRDVDPYPYFKSRITGVYTACSAGRLDDVEDTCREVIEFGRDVGNNRAIAFGHQGLAYLATVLGDYRSAIENGEMASSIAKDPIYRDTAYIGLAIASALARDWDRVASAADHLRGVREAGVDLTTPAFLEIVQGLGSLASGQYVEGMERLLKTREAAKAASRAWEWVMAEFTLGVVYGIIATGESGGGLMDLARNPRLVPHYRRAKKEALSQLQYALDQALLLGFEGVAGLAGVEIARVLLHRGDNDGARSLLEDLVEWRSAFGDGEGLSRMRDLLETI